MLQVLMREEFSDLNLVVGRNLIAVHQLVLGAHSSQVALVFSNNAKIFFLLRKLKIFGREMENISRGPAFGDFVTIRTEASTQDVTVARLQGTRVQNPLSPLLNVMYCVRVSLWTFKIFLG